MSSDARDRGRYRLRSRDSKSLKGKPRNFVPNADPPRIPDQSGARAEAIEALGKIGDPEAISAILSAMEAGSPAVRKRAISALSKFRDPRTIQALMSALTDPNEEIRSSAAIGLADIGDASCIAKLESMADSDSSSDVRSTAAQAVERIRAQQRALTPKSNAQKKP